MRFSRAIFLLFLGGCSSSSTVPISDNTSWVFASTDAADPFRTESGASTECTDDSFGAEDEGEDTWFSVETKDCSYITVKQALLEDVHEGDTVTVNIFHFALTAPDPGEAHLAVAFGSDVVWETRIPIPAASGQVLETFEAPSDYEKGTEIFYHLHNHGQNSYALVEMLVTQ